MAGLYSFYEFVENNSALLKKRDLKKVNLQIITKQNKTKIQNDLLRIHQNPFQMKPSLANMMLE